MAPARKWTTDENLYLMEAAYRLPWSEIAKSLERTESACKKHYEKIKDLRIKMGTWKGL